MLRNFTLISYSPKVGLRTEVLFKYDNNLKIYSKYDQGSFKENRKHLYQCIHDREFKITLSGHSHRAALYEPNFDAGWLRDTLNTVGHEIEHTHDMNIPFYGRTPIVVSGCGGPIGVQNHYAAPKANAWKSQDHLIGELLVEHCALKKFDLIEATIKSATFRNSSLSDCDNSDVKVGELVLDSVTLGAKIDFTNARVDHLKVKNLQKRPGLRLITTGSNLKLD